MLVCSTGSATTGRRDPPSSCPERRGLGTGNVPSTSTSRRTENNAFVTDDLQRPLIALTGNNRSLITNLNEIAADAGRGGLCYWAFQGLPPPRGKGPTLVYLSTVEVLKDVQRAPSTWQWSSLRRSTFLPRSNAAAVYHNGTIYIVGGRMCRPFETCIMSSAESFSVTGGGRTMLPAMSTARFRPQAAIFQAALYVVGGRSSNEFTFLASGERLDLQTMRWTVLPRLVPHRRSVLAVFPHSGTLHIVAANTSLNGTDARITRCYVKNASNATSCSVVELPQFVPQYGTPGVALRGNMVRITGGRLCTNVEYLKRVHECLPPEGNLAVNLLSRKVRRGGPPGSLPQDRRLIQDGPSVDLGEVGILALGGQQVQTTDKGKAWLSTADVSLFETKWDPPAPLISTTATSTSSTPSNRPDHSRKGLRKLVAFSVLTISMGLAATTWCLRRPGPATEDDEQLIELETIGSVDKTTTSSAASSGSGIGVVTFTWSAADAIAKPYLKPQDIQPTPPLPYPRIGPMILTNPLDYPPILSSRQEAVALVYE